MSLRKSWAALAVLSLIASVFTFFAQSAAAAAPPWEPDPNSNGTVAFYNSSGTQITSGTNLNHLFAFAAASSAGDPNGFSKASALFAFPDHTKSDPIDWFVVSASAATTYPNASAPAPINTFTNPVVTPGSLDVNLNAAQGAATKDTTAGYANIVQVRLAQSGGTGYWATDISYDLVAGTWTQVYPTPVAGPTTTTTTLGTSPSSPQVSGTNVTLTATVSPSGAVGSVQFKDGATNLGTPVTVSGGTASKSTTTLTVATHSLTAVFTPTDAAAFTTSTSSAASYTITSAATSTSTALDITPTTPIIVGPTSTMTATLTPSTAVGSVQFKDGATNIGSPVTVSGGTASTTKAFAVNTHSVTAVFTPTDPTAFTGSTSPAVSYVVNPAPATSTTTTLGISPSSPQTYGATLTFTGTVSPSNAVGTVEFREGVTVIASGSLSGGTATGTTSTLGAGSHSLTAVFVPTTPADFGTSTSSAASYTINQAATTTTLGVTPAGPQQQGTSITLSATTTPSGVGGAVQFMDGATPIGLPVAVVSGHATTSTTALTVGTHSLSANFLPAGGNYSASSSSSTSYEITKPPAGTTTTTLSVLPGGPVTQGTSETLHATVSPSAAAGTVQFYDGDTAIGSPVTLASGVAEFTTTLAVGTHSLTAHFASADITNFLDSTSVAMSYLVKPPPTATTTTLDVTPASPATFGTSVTLNAGVSNSAAGTVAFADGATALGSSPVSSGTASLTVALPGGTHSLVATFMPSAPLDFAGSHSDPVSYTENAVDTTTSLAVTAGPVAEGSSVTMTATVTPSAAAGSVEFKNGSTSLGSANVSGGTAVLHTATLPAGTASITATLTAATPANYATSTSAPVTIEVVAPPEFDSVTSNGSVIHDGDTLEPGQSLDLSASGFQPNEPVDVEVHSTVVTLATVNADADGKVVVTVTLPTSVDPGDHVLTITGALGAVALNFTIADATTTEPPPGSGVSGSGGNLANTGFEVVGGVLIACLLAGAGVIVLLLGTRRGGRGLHRIG